MAPKPLVPANFGIENLYDEFHGNVVMKLKDSVEMKANSMILKMNSPVFGEIFRNLQIRTIDMDDFSIEAVTVFLESLYTGEVEPNKDLFMDLTKMSNVFEVTWMVAKCENYFCDLVRSTEDSDYDGLKFVFEEARFLKNSVKKPGFLEIVLEKLSNMADKGALFVTRYMEQYLDLSKEQLNLMIQIVGESTSMLMNIMKNNLDEQGLNLDENTKFLLQNINLVNCMEQDMQLYEDFFDLLLEEIENISNKDLKMLTKLNRDTTKEFQLTKAQNKVQTGAALATASGTQVVSVCNIPNLFNSMEQFKGLRPLHQWPFYAALFASTDIKSLYMMFESMEWKAFLETVTEERLQQIVKIKQERGWCAVLPEFIYGLMYTNATCYRLITSYTELVSSSDSKMIVCNEVIHPLHFVTNEKMYRFYINHPKTTRCPEPTKCGFLIKVTPLTKANPEQFNMQLVTDTALYPADIHLHSDVISADNIHLALEGYTNILRSAWFNMHISWLSKPVYKNEEVMWGGWWLAADHSNIRFTAYYDMTK